MFSLPEIAVADKSTIARHLNDGLRELTWLNEQGFTNVCQLLILKRADLNAENDVRLLPLSGLCAPPSLNSISSNSVSVADRC